MFYDTQPFPWWGPSFGFGLAAGAQTTEDIPLTVNGDGEAKITRAPVLVGLGGIGLSGRQSFFPPASPHYGPQIWPGGNVSTVDQARDSNSSNAAAMLGRATARLASNYHNYRRMRADGMVAIGREFADALTCTALLQYEQSKPETPSEWVDEVREMWEGKGAVAEAHEGFTLREYFFSESCRAKDHGNHTLEIVYGEDGEGLTAIDEFLPLLPENTRPLTYTGTRKFAGVKNWGVNGQEIQLAPEYCARFIYDGEGGDFFGRSRFENCKDWIQIKWEIRDKIRTDLNASIGNIMKIGYPAGATAAETATNEAKAQTISTALSKGFSVTYQDFSIQQKLSLALAKVDPSQIRTWNIDRLDTGPGNFAGFKEALATVDEQILFGLLVLPRSVREAEHGSKADAESHTDSMMDMQWRWICYVAGMAQNITDRIMVERHGEEARGAVKVTAAPITDEARGVLKQAFTTLLSDASFAVKVADIKAAAEKLKIKLVDGFDQKQLAQKMDAQANAEALSSRERLKQSGYSDEDADRVLEEKRGEDTVPTDPDGLGDKPPPRETTQDPYWLSDDGPDEGGGRWVTISGVHVYIGKGGQIEKGPKSMVGKTPSEVAHASTAKAKIQTKAAESSEGKPHANTMHKVAATFHRKAAEVHQFAGANGGHAQTHKAAAETHLAESMKHQSKVRESHVAKVPTKTPKPEHVKLHKNGQSRRVDRVVQQYSEEYNEPVLAKSLGGQSYRDSEPVDVVVHKAGKIEHGVELKTMTENKNNKITMNKQARGLKAAWMVENEPAAFHTVVFDDHKVFNAKGEGQHDDSKRRIFYKRGYGSFRVGSMHEVGSMGELSKLMNTPTEQLPKKAAAGTSGPTPKELREAASHALEQKRKAKKEGAPEKTLETWQAHADRFTRLAGVLQEKQKAAKAAPAGKRAR
jgi:hypothetical protein